MTQKSLISAVQSLENRVCNSAKIGYGGSLILTFEKNEDEIVGQHEIRTNYCSWRLLKNSSIVVGDYDDEPDVKDKLGSLISSKVLGVVLTNNAVDLKIEFEGKFVLELFASSHNEYSWQMLLDKSYIEAHPENGLEAVSSDHRDEFRSAEKAVSLHSKACANRWKSVIPKIGTDTNCEHCACYRALQGQYYFWDYGLCTNPESMHDGKVTNVKSTCNSYRTDLQAEQQ